jgi:hypothetical protein
MTGPLGEAHHAHALAGQALPQQEDLKILVIQVKLWESPKEQKRSKVATLNRLLMAIKMILLAVKRLKQVIIVGQVVQKPEVILAKGLQVKTKVMLEKGTQAKTQVKAKTTLLGRVQVLKVPQVVLPAGTTHRVQREIIVEVLVNQDQCLDLHRLALLLSDLKAPAVKAKQVHKPLLKIVAEKVIARKKVHHLPNAVSVHYLQLIKSHF